MLRVIFCASGEEFCAPRMPCVLGAPVTRAMAGLQCRCIARSDGDDRLVSARGREGLSWSCLTGSPET